MHYFYYFLREELKKIILYPELSCSELFRLRANGYDYGRQWRDQEAEKRNKARKNLIRRNPKSKFEEKNPLCNYEEMIENKVERIVRLNEKEIEDYYPGKRKENREKRIIRSKNREKKQKISFGKTLKKTRKWNNITQNQLAKESGLNRSYISGIEQGKHNPTLKEIRNIANSFNLYTYEFLESNLKNLNKRNFKPKEENINKLFGKMLKKIRNIEDEKRKIYKISQKELAEKSNLNRTYIAKIEKGNGNIGLVNIFKIAYALKINPSQLFKSE